jgi:Tfp pilus assembly protein PilZ
MHAREEVMMQNRRRSERKPLAANVECHTAFTCIKARIKNIGTLGVFVETDSPLGVGSRLRLVFELPEGVKIEANGIVAHRETGRGIGVAFISIGAEEAKHIRGYIEAE